MGTEAWYSLIVVPNPLTTLNAQGVVVAPPETSGVDVGTATALLDHVRGAGHPPVPIGATCTEPGVLEVVAQLM
jgi:hypothetical protein